VHEESPDAVPGEALDTPGVELVHWPAEPARRERLARSGIARLLLVAPGCEPPSSVELDEDWMRLPAAAADIALRADRLARVAAILDEARPWIDGRRLLHRGPAAVQLTAAEAIVAAALLAAPGVVVARRDLERHIWAGSTPPSERAVDAVVYRLRRRASTLHLHIRTVRSRGFVLDL
jgi:two-component system, OmpR family, response regulator